MIEKHNVTYANFIIYVLVGSSNYSSRNNKENL